jgi:hypothetical protein
MSNTPEATIERYAVLDRPGSSYINIIKDSKIWIAGVERSIAIEIVTKLNNFERLEKESKWNLEQCVKLQRENLALRAFLVEMTEGSAYFEKKVEILFNQLK